MTSQSATTLTKCLPAYSVPKLHPAVREGVVVRGRSGPVAFIVPDDRYLDHSLGRAEIEQKRLQTWRKTHDLMQLGKAAEAAPVAFKTTGWNSSYTRQPIPGNEMREWVEMTVSNIQSLAPREVLEIGCGNGLLLLRLAPRCKRYVATDFAPTTLKRVREQMDSIGGNWENVELWERSAEIVEGYANQSFDTVVINSVVQYFPNLAYLNRVIENIIPLVKPGGHIFVGDCRSLPLLPLLAVSLELYHANRKQGLGDLAANVHRRLEREEELVLSPAYFLSLTNHPLVASVEVRPKRGIADNELTRYRFDALISVGERRREEIVQWQSWTEEEWSIPSIRRRLLAGKLEMLSLHGVRNSRLEKDVRCIAELQNPTLSIGEMNDNLQHLEATGIDPQALLDLGSECGYNTQVSWNSCKPDGSFDATFIPQGIVSGAIAWPGPSSRHLVRLGNAPGQGLVRAALGKELSHAFEGEQVQVVLIDSIPVRADGSADEEALLANDPRTHLSAVDIPHLKHFQ